VTLDLLAIAWPYFRDSVTLAIGLATLWRTTHTGERVRALGHGVRTLAHEINGMLVDRDARHEEKGAHEARIELARHALDAGTERKADDS
jgi:hypothetical protein